MVCPVYPGEGTRNKCHKFNILQSYERTGSFLFAVDSFAGLKRSKVA